MSSELIIAFVKKNSLTIVVVLVALFFAISIFGFDGLGGWAKVVTVGDSSEEFIGENFEDVITSLERAGFTNVETETIDDVVVGVLKKVGEVETVSIDGTTAFDDESKFAANAKVVVTYHKRIW